MSELFINGISMMRGARSSILQSWTAEQCYNAI